MASVLQGEKQLFEKFWQGTFKAVAMPRPESIIVASITARRAVTKLETAVSLAPKDDEEKAKTKEAVAKTHEKSGHEKRRGRKRHSHRRARSVSFDSDLSPRPVPKAKKKKKKSQRKRRRHRSPSCSPSPVRKKKKKKSSKKRKRHRSASRKGRHSGSSPRSKRKEDKKHKKRARSHSHRRHRRRKAEIRSSSCKENRYEDCGKSGLQDGGHSSAVRGGNSCRSAIKLTSKISSKCCCHFSESTVSPSRPGVEGLHKMVIVQDSMSNKGKGHADYDSGNDTSSPLSSKTGIPKSKVSVNGKFRCQDLTSPEKLRLNDGDNASDSGNSLTSYDSLGKPVLKENTLHSSVFNKFKGEEAGRCSDLEKTQPLGVVTDRNRSPSYDRYQDRARSRSRSISSQSRYSGRYSRSRSLSLGRRSYSRSSSYSLDSRRDSQSSASSLRSLNHSRCTLDRFRERKRDCSSCKSRKHSRRRPRSPMRKRRRDSPSHLEARRITSARKRPIPYYRPSPSVSSRSSSILSWRLFSLNRSRSRSRSHTYSSYRSYSRSSSWNSMYSRRSRSRSRSYESVVSYSRARR
ncbi:serine/arginine repetitive matrix protein 4-like [Carassius gibelio]|uniref:serine/arginine repetitive matrix protein 4-like n=1 Tax=Carassius gibelio TaxID=101364 RepID=UPI0022774F30|nr:serine/arginine repetitive matrix protein 4-like [Carassius gibelio]